MALLTLFWEYFKIGLFTIGGGYAMLPMVEQAVMRNGWLTTEELINFIGVAESTPGPFAINLATFVGINVGGATVGGLWGSFVGAVIATFAVVLPSLVIIILVTKLLSHFRNNKYVESALYGVRPVVVGLIASAVLSIGSAVVLPDLELTAPTKEGFGTFNWVSLLIFCAFLPLSKIKVKGKKLHPIFIIVLSAIVGIVVFGIFNVNSSSL